jgi:hypothetical protein
LCFFVGLIQEGYVQVRLEGLSKYVVNWVMSAGDLVLDRSREVLTNIRTVYIIDEVSI